MMSAGLAILASGLFLMTLGGVPEAVRRARRTFRGWYLAAVGALILAVSDVPFYWGLPIWNPVLRSAFHWTAGQMSLAYAFTQIQGGFLGPVQGLIVQKLGARRSVLLGMIIFGLGFVAFSRIQHLWHLYPTFVVLSLGSGLAAWYPVQTVVNNWFVRYKTRAMAVVAEGLAVGAIGIPLLLAWSIGGTDAATSERFGWRTTAFFIGMLSIALAFPLSRVMHNRPEDVGLKPDGDSSVPAVASHPRPGGAIEQPGYTVQEALRSRAFWLISVAFALSSTVTVVILVHLGLMLDDRGYSLQTIGLVTAVYTGTTSVFILVGGYIGDRFNITIATFGFSALQSVAVVVLVLANNTEMVFLFAVLLGIGFGARQPLTMSLRGLYFGRRAFAAISGLSRMPSSIVLFVAPIFAGVLRDTTGTYNEGLLGITAVSFLGSCMYLLVGPPPAEPARRTRPATA